MRYIEPTKEEQDAYNQWLSERPESIRKLAEKFDPWSLYRMKTSGHRATIVSFYEDGTLKVSVDGNFNAVLFDTAVFGVDPDDLELCDLPSDEESCGTALTDEQVSENIDQLRVSLAPDLWEMDEGGKAVKRT